MVNEVIANVLNMWEQAGFFSYLIPFLLIFALVFGILTKTRIFGENKAIGAIIALAVGLISLQFDMVPTFFSQIFPRLGIALAIILIILIVGGLFFDPENKFFMVGLTVIALIIVAVVIIQTAGAVGWTTGTWWQENLVTIIGVIVFLALVIAVIAGASPRAGRPPAHGSILARALRGEEHRGP